MRGIVRCHRPTMRGALLHTSISWGVGAASCPLGLSNLRGISNGDCILDVGCGTGSLTRVLLESAGVKSIVGVDLADIYLESATQTIRDPRATFKTGDATSLPFEDKSFDRAFAMLVLHFVPDAKKAVSEMRRVVRSGGVVAATVWDSLGGMPAQRLFWDAAATLGIANDKVLRDYYFRPMTRPHEMLAHGPKPDSSQSSSRVSPFASNMRILQITGF
jgi:ubiquinone/menaquinone biosynthesis C-methylase UbiE